MAPGQLPHWECWGWDSRLLRAGAISSRERSLYNSGGASGASDRFPPCDFHPSACRNNCPKAFPSVCTPIVYPQPGSALPAEPRSPRPVVPHATSLDSAFPAPIHQLQSQLKQQVHSNQEALPLHPSLITKPWQFSRLLSTHVTADRQLPYWLALLSRCPPLFRNFTL